ncbi:MAG: hypothetical protein ACM37W_26355 [Actinomycetota bacterium]
MLTQPNVLELAKLGNPQAIAALLNHHLQRKGITVKATLKEEGLRIKVESEQVPPQQLVSYIHQGIATLNPQSIKTIKIYGFQAGQNLPAWKQELSLFCHAGPIKISIFNCRSSKNFSIYFLTEWLKSRFLVKVLCYNHPRLFPAESDKRGIKQYFANGSVSRLNPTEIPR